ncbi:PH domain-containing protein [candidate division KSB1 bacterium]
MLHLHEGEHVDIKARKHWFMLFRDSFGILAVYLLPFIGWKFLISQSGVSLPPTDGSLQIFLSSLWTLIIWAKLFAIWTDYYLDIWVVTSGRIVNVDQKGLFHREVSTLRMERIQDVTYEIDGIVATVLGFGDVHVQTAGEVKEFVIKGIKDPERVKKKILGHINTKANQGARF